MALLLTAPTLHAQDKIVGRIHDVHGDALQACFYDGQTPGIGETFVLERHVAGSHPKGETPIRREKVGAVRIAAAVGVDHCAAAELTKGTVQQADWLVAPLQ